jgi:very-short-patch-repair endonuclease
MSGNVSIMRENRGIVVRQRVQPEKVRLAKEFRQNPTPAERELWSALRRNQLDGHHFRRQQVIAGFIVDFYCHGSRLAIEIDGNVHMGRLDYDSARDAALEQLDIRVARFSNEDVMERFNDVLDRIRSLCSPR